MKINKLLLSMFAVFMLATSQVQAGVSIGLTGAYNMLETSAKEDIDNNGSTDATKVVDDDAFSGSIFLEYSFDTPNGGVTIGLDYIPLDADIEKRSISQVSWKDKSTAKSSGTNSAEGTISDHFTFYLQPSASVTANTSVFATIGWAMADVTGKSNSISSTNLNKAVDLEGIVYGIGLKTNLDDGMFMKLDVKYSDYDSVSWTTSNSTKGTADIENLNAALSLGYSF